MVESMSEMSCSAFVHALAAKEPVPGGGGAAALVGAVAAALCSMVGNYTVGKKSYADVEKDIRLLLEQASSAQHRLLSLMDEDAKAFEPLSRAYRISRDDPTRTVMIEEATKGACAPPLNMMRELAHVIQLLKEMGEKGSRMLASDAACGLVLARAALEAASVNVFVNTRSLTDHSFAESIEGECNQLLEHCVPCAERALSQLMSEICSK